MNLTMMPALGSVAALLLVLSAPTFVFAAPPTGPSFDCAKVQPGSIAALVCADAGLAQLDQQLSQVYGQALKKAAKERPPLLKAEQRGWVKGRDECWKSQDKPACVKDSYVHRIAELQARYRLLPAQGPFRWACDGNAAKEVVVNFFATEPPTLVAEFGDSSSLMFAERSASGSRYVGRNESFWEHQGEARIVWGYQAPEMVCRHP
ncbi:MliC family protein [Paucibacter sp. DJ1R-11]|uniref:MliC family protein n=1 Tax=Paucibacter sp. DJ1R-11 TaxID=2893556 RepID=UPI0021E38EED|nr:MliC family protein [Paucibacter sp. DJ1R-11]MCV2364884.1 MliC family protein [Paucibacter sp. DJ1R-11]